MRKPSWLIYINNTIAFSIYSFLKIFFKKRSPQKNTHFEETILFINTGQIGDLVISSVILENLFLFPRQTKIFFLIKKKYKSVYTDYDGKVSFIEWNNIKYKYNIFHRIFFLSKLRQNHFSKCINLTSARGIINDELSLLSGAKEISCLSSSWKYLKKLFGRKMDLEYDLIHTFNVINEFERQAQIIEKLTGKKPRRKTNFYLRDETIERAKKIFKEKFEIEPNACKIVISPLSDLKIKNWELNKYIELCKKITKETETNVVLLGNKKQKKRLEKISKINKSRIINSAGSFSILESASLVKLSKVFIGNDSGFAHIAKALNKKHIAIIGGGTFDMFFPYETENNGEMFYYKMDCFGCQWYCIHDKPYCHFNVKTHNVFERVIESLV